MSFRHVGERRGNEATWRIGSDSADDGEVGEWNVAPLRRETMVLGEDDDVSRLGGEWVGFRMTEDAVEGEGMVGSCRRRGCEVGISHSEVA